MLRLVFSRGDNDPRPRGTLCSLEEELSEEHDDLFARRAELLAAFERTPEECTEANAEAFAKSVKIYANTLAMFEQRRRAAKQPFLEGGRTVDAFFAVLKEPLERALLAMRSRLTDYQMKKAEAERRAREEEAARARERERILREEAERQAAAMETEADLDFAAATEEMADQAAAQADDLAKRAAAPAAELGRVRTDKATATLRTTWDFEVVDLAQVPREYLMLDAAKVRRAIAGENGLREIPGLRIFARTQTVVR